MSTATEYDWKGCGECDCSFPCHNGEARCIRLPQQAEPALIGSDLFPSKIRLADGRDVQLGELVRRAAHGLEATQWNLLPQKARDSAMVKALDDWQRGLTTQQQAEPVFYVRPQDIGADEAYVSATKPFADWVPLYTSPRITTAQVEELKRLADEYARFVADEQLLLNWNEEALLASQRAALHAALDALKGTP